MTDAETEFRAIYETHRGDVWLYCRRRLGIDRADDAMGDVFLTVWRRLDRAPPLEDVLPWLYRIAHLTVRNHDRSAIRRDRLRRRAQAEGTGLSTSVAHQVVMRDELELVLSALSQLKPSDAEILRLRAWEHLTTDQIASVLAITTDAAKQRLSRARKRLVKRYRTTTRSERTRPLLREKGGGR